MPYLRICVREDDEEDKYYYYSTDKHTRESIVEEYFDAEPEEVKAEEAANIVLVEDVDADPEEWSKWVRAD